MEEQAGVVQKAYSLVLQGILFIKLQKHYDAKDGIQLEDIT